MTAALYVIAIMALSVSLLKSKEKTILALKKAWKSFENILPQFLSILIIIGILLTVLSPEQISKLLGKESGWYGVLIAAVIGSVTLVPGFIAFPLAAALLKSGAGYMQIAAFISALMMVGIVTIPVEVEYFGKKAAAVRNIAAFVFSLFVALVMGVVM
ncbi:MAG TPA: permease [Bacillota bacterium]|nr:permease [Bacillota bacterium]